jgi:hypothetical protein
MAAVAVIMGTGTVFGAGRLDLVGILDIVTESRCGQFFLRNSLCIVIIGIIDIANSTVIISINAGGRTSSLHNRTICQSMIQGRYDRVDQIDLILTSLVGEDGVAFLAGIIGNVPLVGTGCRGCRSLNKIVTPRRDR